MKFCYKLAAVLIFTFWIQFGQAQRGVWKRINDLGANRINSATPKSSPAVFTVNGKAYVGAGFNGNAILSSDFWAYDPVADTWTQKASFPGKRRYTVVGFSISGKGYVTTGSDSTLEVAAKDFNDLWEYDPAVDQWTQKASLPAMPRAGAVGFSIGSYGYVGLGITDSNITMHKDFWRYDPGTDSWTQMADFGGSPRENAVAFVLLGKAYVTTGDTLGGRCSRDKDVWQYDPANNAWVQKADFGGAARTYAVATAADSFAIVGTGKNDTTRFMKDLWKYNPFTDSWTQIPNAGAFGRLHAVAFTLNNMPYLTMGNDSSSGLFDHQNEEVWQYNSGSNNWVQKANSGIGTISWAGSFSVGNNGYVYGGGSLYSYPYNRFWQYDPATGNWNAKSTCPENAGNQAVAFSAGGNGYVLYQKITGDSVNRLWQYNPASNAWAQKAPFANSGLGVANVVFNYGSQIWVPGNSAVSASIYNVAADSWSATQYDLFYLQGGCAFTIGDTVYNGCGIQPGIGNGTCEGTFALHDTLVDFTHNAPTIPGREYEVAFVVNGKAYVGLGDDCNYNTLADMYEYDPAKATFTKVADFPGGPRKNATAFSIGGRGYIGTGQYFNYCYKDFWSFNPNSCFADTQQLCIVNTDTILQSPVVIWEKVNKSATDSFYIYRANTPDSAYTLVAMINRDTLSQWEDTSAHANQQSYRYKIAVKDTCGFINDLSNYHQTMFLTSAGHGQFSWTPYAIENSSPPQGSYYFYRDTAGNGNWQVLQVLSDTQTHAVDTAYASYPNARYMLVIELSNPCNPTRAYTTITSNILSGTNNTTGLFAQEVSRVKVFPNPTRNQVTIYAPGIEEVSITNVLGQLVYQSTVTKDLITLPTSEWAKGVYFYQVKTKLSLFSGKVVKE